MKAVLMTGPGELSFTDSQPVPQLEPHQLLVKVECSSILASDYHMTSGEYAKYMEFHYPMVPGLEGSGTVVQAGSPPLEPLIGMRVAFTRDADFTAKVQKQHGAWAEYCVVNSQTGIFPLDERTTFESAATSTVNPLTTIGLLDESLKLKPRAVAQTGASSQMGRMLNKVFKQHGIPMINIVRRPEKVEELKIKYGYEYVLDSSSPTFQQDLNDLSTQLGLDVIIDAVGGAITGQLVEALQTFGTVFIYGLLSEEAIRGIQPYHMIWKHVTIRGFFMGHFFRGKTLEEKMQIMARSRELVEEEVNPKSFGLH